MCVKPPQDAPGQKEHREVIRELRTLAEGGMEGCRAEADQAQGDREEVEALPSLWAARTSTEGDGRKAECIVD